MNKMQRGGYIPTAQAKAGAKEFKRAQAKRDRAARAAGPPATAPRPTQNREVAKRLKKNVKAGNKARRRISRSIQRRLVKVK